MVIDWKTYGNSNTRGRSSRYMNFNPRQSPILESRQHFSKNRWIHRFPSQPIVSTVIYTVCYCTTRCYEKLLCWFIRNERILASRNMNIMALDFHGGARTNHYYYLQLNRSKLPNDFSSVVDCPATKLMKVSKELSIKHKYSRLNRNWLSVTF